MLRFLSLILVAWLAPAGFAQDCRILVQNWTSAGQTNTFDNRRTGCVSWRFTYNSTGFSALSIVVQTAPDASGSPGSFSTFTPTTGANPNTTTTQNAASFDGYFPWVRVELTSKTGTGTVNGVLNGWRTESLSSPLLFNGSTFEPGFVCSNRAKVTLTASGNTQIIAAVAGAIIRICHISFSPASSFNFKFTEGTGSNCATGTADISDFYQVVTATALDFSPGAALRSSVSQAVCINQSVAVTTGGVVVYAQF